LIVLDLARRFQYCDVQDERLSCATYDQHEINEFVECCDRNDLCDAPASVFFYTWRNHQEEGLQVWFKLYRGLLNSEAAESE